MPAQPVEADSQRSPGRAAADTVLRVSDPRELLAYVPHAIGFRPRRSVVLVSIRAPRGRLGLIVRVDSADVSGPSGAEVLAELGRHLLTDGAERTLAVVYVDAPDPAAARTPALARLVGRIEACDVLPPIEDVWLVGPDWYACESCRDRSCCPPEGAPLTELEETSVAAAFVLAGSAPAADRSELAPGEERAPGPRASFTRALRAAARVRAEHGPDPERLTGCLDVLTGRVPASPSELGRLGEAVGHRIERDSLIAALVEPMVPTLDRAAVDEAFARVYGPEAPAPRSEVTESSRRVLVLAVRLARGRVRADLLAMLAWLCWWCGEGAAAGIAAQEAVGLVPDHSLAGLVLRAVAGGIPPGWARHQGPGPGSGRRRRGPASGPAARARSPRRAASPGPGGGGVD